MTLPSEAVLVSTLVCVAEADAEGTVVDAAVADADADDCEGSMCQRLCDERDGWVTSGNSVVA